jgi:ATP phosphoribosyltransferase-like protein
MAEEEQDKEKKKGQEQPAREQTADTSKTVQANPDFDINLLKVPMQPNEEPLEVIFKHWGSIFVSLAGISILSFGSVAVLFILALFTDFTATTYVTAVVIVGIIYVTLGAFGLSEWYSVKRSALIVTNQRLIDVQHLNVASRKVQTLAITEILDCIPQKKGVMSRFFNFGDVSINTFNDKILVIQNLPVPESVAQQIMHYHNFIVHAAVAERHNPFASSVDEDKMPPAIEPKAEQLGRQTSGSLPTEQTASQDQEKDQAKKPPAFKPRPQQLSPSPLPSQPQLTQPPPQQPPPVASPAIVTIPPEVQQLTTEDATLIRFHIASDKAPSLISKLPAQKEPTVNYLEHTGYVEVESVVPNNQIQPTVEQIREAGGEDITATEAHILG